MMSGTADVLYRLGLLDKFIVEYLCLKIGMVMAFLKNTDKFFK